MSSNTTTVPVPPARWFTGPDRERIQEIQERAAQVSANAGPFPGLAVEPDPDEARRTCEQIQAGSRRTTNDNLATAAAIAEDKAKRANLRAGKEFVRGLNRARVLLRQAAAIKPDDTVGEFAAYLAHQIDQAVERASSEVVPDAAPSLPEVPGVGKEADRG
jgi:hypothetical protein